MLINVSQVSNDRKWSTWNPDPSEGLLLSNGNKTLRNTNRTFRNHTFSDLISSGSSYVDYIIDSSSPGACMEMGVCAQEDIHQTLAGGHIPARELGYLYFWYGGQGKCFGRGNWKLHHGYEPGERIRMRVNVETRILSFYSLDKDLLLAECTGIPKKVVMFASLAPINYNVQVTLL